MHHRPAVGGARCFVPLALRYDDATINAMVFSIDINTNRLLFDPADHNGDGVPDAVSFPAGMPSIAYVDYDPNDADGEIDVMLTNLSGAPLPQDIILEFEFISIRRGSIFNRIRFSDDPPPSFGDAQGQNVAGTAQVLGHKIFADGFESGNTRAWSRTKSPRGQL